MPSPNEMAIHPLQKIAQTLLAKVYGQNPEYLSKAFGINLREFRSGGTSNEKLDARMESRRDQALEFARQTLRDLDASDAMVHVLIDEMPTVKLGTMRPTSDLIHNLAALSHTEYPDTAILAAEMDNAAGEDQSNFDDSIFAPDSQHFLRRALGPVAGEGEVRNLLARRASLNPEESQRLYEIASALAWPQLLARLEIEWAAQCKTERHDIFKMKPYPIFAALAPVILAPPDEIEVGKPWPRRAIHHPMRRLLDVTIGLAGFLSSGKWPPKPPQPRHHAIFFGAVLPKDKDHRAMLRDIANGEKKTNLIDYRQLSANAFAHVGMPEFMNTLPMFLAAQYFDLVSITRRKRKLASVITDGGNFYRLFWEAERNRASPAPSGDKGWPEWVTLQSGMRAKPN